MKKYIAPHIVKEIQAIASIETVLNHYDIHVKGKDKTKGVSKCPKCNKDYDDVKYNTEKELINCFVCGFGGNVFNVIMEIEGCDFVESVCICADIIGYSIPEDSDSKDIMRDAAIFYLKCYKDHLGFRGINADIAKSFGVGYAPGQKALVNHLLQLGYSQNQILESGLGKLKDSVLSDKYFKAAVFPEIRGKKVIDFYFRLIDDNYKSKHQLLKGKNNLIGHHMIKDSKAIGICEAPIDAASFTQMFDIPAVAICGAWTKLSNSIRTLIQSKGIEQVIVAFDNDDSGRIATFELIGQLLDLNVEILVLQLGNCKDVNMALVQHEETSFEDGRYLYLKHMAANFSDEMLKRLVEERNIV